MSDDDDETEDDSGEPGETDRPLSVLGALGWGIASLFVAIFALEITALIRSGRESDLVNAQICFTLAFAVCIYGVARLYLPQRSTTDALGLRPASAAVIVLSALTGAAMLVPAAWLSGLIELRFPRSDEELARNAAAYSMTSIWHKAAFATATVALGPVSEDLFFRGTLFRALRRTQPAWTTTLASACAFTLVHPDLRMMPVVLLAGIALGYMRGATGSVISSTVAHVAYNGAITFAILSGAVSVGDRNDNVPHLVGVAGLAVTLALLFGLGVVARRSEAMGGLREEDTR